jgi:hypothetical protein
VGTEAEIEVEGGVDGAEDAGVEVDEVGSCLGCGVCWRAVMEMPRVPWEAGDDEEADAGVVEVLTDDADADAGATYGA